LIVKTGIAKAIAMQLGGLKGNKDAIAETIENNVRRKIIKEHLNDPAYYEKMSALLTRSSRPARQRQLSTRSTSNAWENSPSGWKPGRGRTRPSR
jgi:hypothetical protein